MRQLEERNAGHAERTRQLEDELRRAGSLRAQLEAQRRQVRQGSGQSLEGSVLWAAGPLAPLTLAHPQHGAEPLHPEPSLPHLHSSSLGL